MTGGRRSEILYDGTSVVAGRFRCPPADGSWLDENRIGDWHHVVFARRPVMIRQAGHRPICADRRRAVLYDDGQLYRRELVHPDGDRADFVAVAPAVVQEALATHRVATADAGSFGTPAVAVDDAVFVAQRLLFRGLRAGTLDPMAAEEQLLRLVDVCVSACGQGVAPAGASGHAELAEAAAVVLAGDLGTSIGLAELGARLHVSPFHLARVFRAQTGSSLHAYREGERLRAAVDAGLATTGSLSRLAADLGFSSHSHLSARFRMRFGMTPTELLRRSA